MRQGRRGWKGGMAATALAALAVASSPEARADIMVFKVKSVRGEVLIWQQSFGSWLPVRPNLLIQEDSLVQFGAESNVKVYSLPTPESRTLRELDFSAKDPVITRLSSHSVRNFDMGGYFISMPEQLAETGKEKAPLARIQNSWERFTSLFNFDQDRKTEDVTDQSVGDMNSGRDAHESRTVAQEMKIVSPRNGETYLVSEFPTDIAVVWEKVPAAEPMKYKVYLTKGDKLTDVLVGESTMEYHVVRIFSAGHYNLVVETADGKHRSRRHKLLIEGL